MGVCPCFGRRGARKYGRDSYENFKESKCQTPKSSGVTNLHSESGKREMKTSLPEDELHGQVKGSVFNYRELAAATRNFHPDCFIGEGGFGSVYKGKLERTGQVVAVKRLNPFGLQGDKEFLVEVLMLSLLRHPNLVNMIGYCAEGDQRLLVLEYLPLGSLESHLHDLAPGMEPLDWNTRMKIAAGAARGVDYLHNEADPPVIFRDLKPSNILLDEGFHPKLTDFGLAKFGPSGDSSHVSTRVMGTYGYCAPEYAETGKLTMKSDTFSFGVVLLELITGHRALDLTRRHGRHSLVDWALPLLRDKKHHLQLVDQRLKERFPMPGLHRAFEVVAMCLREDAQARPTMHEVANAMEFLTSQQVSLYLRANISSSKDGDCPNETTRMLAKFDREQAVAEAKMWGEKWRDRIRHGREVGANSPST